MPFFVRNILLVDDHSMIRRGLEDMISSLGPSYKIFQATNIQQARSVFSSENIHIVILDLSLEEEYTFDLVKEWRSQSTTLKILMFSMMPKALYEKIVLKAGADIYLEKSLSEDQIREQITLFLTPRTKKNISKLDNEERLESFDSLASLSAQEKKVFSYLIKGETVKNICNLLDLKQTTVTTYKKRIYEKLEVKNPADLIRLAEVYRIIS